MTPACATAAIWEDAGKHKNNGQGGANVCHAAANPGGRSGGARADAGAWAGGEWPQRSVRIILPTAPGGSPDIAARLLGEKITARLGQSVVVESMTAGGGVTGLALVAKGAPPDGYNIAMLTGGFATQAAVLKNLPYDPIKDFVFITSV